jgi:hypothetical protein
MPPPRHHLSRPPTTVEPRPRTPGTLGVQYLGLRDAQPVFGLPYGPHAHIGIGTTAGPWEILLRGRIRTLTQHLGDIAAHRFQDATPPSPTVLSDGWPPAASERDMVWQCVRIVEHNIHHDCADMAELLDSLESMRRSDRNSNLREPQQYGPYWRRDREVYGPLSTACHDNIDGHWLPWTRPYARWDSADQAAADASVAARHDNRHAHDAARNYTNAPGAGYPGPCSP